MASFRSYTGDGVQTNFAVPKYLERENLVVTLDGVPTTAYSWFDSGTIQFSAAPAVGVSIRLQRRTPIDEALAVFTNGEVLTEGDLNTATLQSLYAAEEASDDASAANEKSEEAIETAEGAVATATAADAKSDTAIATANTAATNAAAAVSTANAASSTASGAVTTANAAVATASGAVTAAQAAQAAAEALAATVAIETAADLEYDNSASGLAADDVQEAIDLIAGASGIGALTSDLVSNESEVSGATVTEALDELYSGKANVSHTHPIADVTGLQTALNGKSDIGHPHVIADVTGLQTALDGKSGTSHTHAYSAITDKPVLGNASGLDKATTSEFLANTSNKILITDQVWNAGYFQALATSGNINVDFSAGINFQAALTGNAILKNPTNMKPGQCGVILIHSGAYTISFESKWRFENAVVPTLTAGHWDALFYQCTFSGDHIIVSRFACWA